MRWIELDEVLELTLLKGCRSGKEEKEKEEEKLFVCYQDLSPSFRK